MQQKPDYKSLFIGIAILAAVFWPQIKANLPEDLLNKLPSINILTPQQATAVVYVYEKDATPIPVQVKAALSQINLSKNIPATTFDVSGVDGQDQVPEQYIVPKAEAEKLGLPALVVMAGNEVVKTVKDPKTIDDVLKAVP
jgi:hypothetical protein